MTSADCIVFEDSTLNAINETLPAPTPGRWLRIKDLAGQAGTNLITILHHASETIDGQTSITIPINYGMVELITTGTNWSVVNPPHMGSQVTSYCTTNTVVQVNGAYVPAAGTLTTGSVLEAIGTSNLGYSPALFYSQDWPALRGLVEWNEPLSNETTHTTTTSGAIYVSRFTANTGGTISHVWMEYATAGTSLTAATTGSISGVTGALQDSGGSLVEITQTAHGYFTDYVVTISGVVMTGSTLVNGAWVIQVVDANTYILKSSTFLPGDSYVSGGTSVNSSNCIGIYGSTGALISATGDQVSTWESGSTLSSIEMALATPVPFVAGNTYWVTLVSKGTGTMPGFAVLNAASTGFSTINIGLSAANYRYATNPGSGASRLNSSLTLSSNGSTNNALFWFGLN